MYLYRITNNKLEIDAYLNNELYFGSQEGLFNTKSRNGLYAVNTFVYDDKLYKHFYYFPQDAYQISQILLNFPKVQNNISSNMTILEYSVDKNIAYNKAGFGNYNCLKRKDYVAEELIHRITPFENSTYPVLEFRFDNSEKIHITKRKWILNKSTPLPDSLNDLKKLKQLIYYKLHCEAILNEFGVNYPHGPDGLMRISNHYNNIKKIEIPKYYVKLLY